MSLHNEALVSSPKQVTGTVLIFSPRENIQHASTATSHPVKHSYLIMGP